MTDQQDPIFVIEETIHIATLRGIVTTIGEGLGETLDMLKLFDRFSRDPKNRISIAPASIQEAHAEMIATNAVTMHAIRFAQERIAVWIEHCNQQHDQLLEVDPFTELDPANVIEFWDRAARDGLAIANMAGELPNAALKPFGRQAGVIIALAEGRLERIDTAAAAEIERLRNELADKGKEQKPPTKEKKTPTSRPGHRRRLH